jgi:uncharacterized membrane protein
MRWNWKYAVIAFSIFLIEVLIALFVRDKFIRPFLGDVLVVVLLYFSFRTILKSRAESVAIGVLIFAVAIEVSQFLNLAERLGLEENSVAEIILGSTFDWLDIFAYVVGTFAAYLSDKKAIGNQSIR